MDSWKESALLWIEVQEETGKETKQSKRHHHDGNCNMQSHIRIEQVAVNHKEPCTNAAKHGDKSNGTNNCMALPEKLRGFAVMQIFSALESQVSCIKSQ